MHPGEYVLASDPVVCNAGRESISLEVTNTGDRPVQVGSHYHFAEINSAVKFDRKKALGYRLDIPAGTAVRFEPGDSKVVQLIPMAGKRKIYGFHDFVNGQLDPTEPAQVQMMDDADYSYSDRSTGATDPHSVAEEA